jgi:hypothetical protein
MAILYSVALARSVGLFFFVPFSFAFSGRERGNISWCVACLGGTGWDGVLGVASVYVRVGFALVGMVDAVGGWRDGSVMGAWLMK